MNTHRFNAILILLIGMSLSISRAGITDSLVAHWTFDNDKGTVVLDAGPDSIHGTAYNISYEKGVIGNAVVFNNPQARIYFPDVNLTPHEGISNLEYGSISVWFKYKSVGAQILPVLYFGESATGTPHNSLIIEVGHGGGQDPLNKRLYFTIVNQRFCYDSRENLLEDTWYHFVAVVSPTGNTGYLNGKEMVNRRYNLGSDATYTDFFNDVPAKKMLSLGYGRYGQENPFFTFRGSIDDVRIYNKALSSEDVKLLFEMGDVGDDLSPDWSNVKYGPYDRNVLDFWKAESAAPSPLVVFIHGGGFAAGDKGQARTGTNLEYMKRCRENGVSFAAINYRFRQTTRLDTIMFDIARAIQFLRYKSEEWNIDKNKIAAYGNSAGAGASVWLAFRDDLADPLHIDPVLRESTRLAVAGHLNGQATYDLLLWKDVVRISADWMETMGNYEDLAFYHIPDRTWYDSTEIIQLRHALDMISMLDRQDPPVYFRNSNPDTEPMNSGAVIHHPRHPMYLKSMMDTLGIDNAIVLGNTPVSERVDMLDFFFNVLFDQTGTLTKEQNSAGLFIYPNPASEFIRINHLTGKGAIYDMMGRVCRETLTWENGEIDISGMETGLYFLRMGNEGVRFLVCR